MLEKRPLLSVIVPIYNVASYLQECVNSILEQTYTNLEIILVDDGSTDGSARICNDFEKKDSRIVVIHQKNMGLVQARMNGIMRATGEYATYVDGDDWLEHNTYEILFAEMKEERPDILTYALVEEYPDHRKTMKDGIPEGYYNDADMENLRQQVLFQCNVKRQGVLSNVVLKVVKTELLRSCQSMIPTDITIGEDTLCTFAMFLCANNVHITWIPLYHYRRHNSSMMTSELSFEKCVNMFMNLKKIANDLGNYIIYKNSIIHYIYFLILLKRPDLLLQIQENPFQIEKSDKIALYGAGEFGQKLKGELEKLGYRISVWVDVRYDFLRKQGLEVRSIDILQKENVDCVIVAVLDCETQVIIKKNLSAIGVDERKIRLPRMDQGYLDLIEHYLDNGGELCFN